MALFSFLNENSDITDITWRDRKRFAPIDQMSEHLLRGPSDLSIKEREIIAAYVSALNECEFCHGAHAAVAENFGMDAQLIEVMIMDLEKSHLEDNLKPVMAYVKKLTQSPSKIYKDDAQAVFDAGWSEQALQDVICLTSLFNFFNRLLDGHGIKGNDKIYEYSGEHLTKRGYGVPWFINFIKPFIKKKKQEFLNSDT